MVGWIAFGANAKVGSFRVWGFSERKGEYFVRVERMEAW